MGLVGDNFSRREVIDRLPGMSAMGHVRYSTTGETILRNVQPLFAELDGGGFAVGHNGNLTNGLTLRRQLVHDGAIMQSTSDTEVILHLVARARKNRFIDRFIEGLRQLEGAYSFVALTNKKLIGARDPLGIRPLVIGKLDGAPILASETCALDIIGAKYVRDVENGEVVVFDDDGMHSHKPFPPMAPRPCIFEYIYFARPDSIVGGRSVYDGAQDHGRASSRARRRPRPTSSIPVPDSGVPAAIGYAQESGIPYELGIIRNHYVGRTFIEPTQQIRQLGVRLKHSANRAVVNGKRIVLVDDSIVRGTTSTKIVQMMRDAGAKEVHFRIASPPITHPDYYGIDTPERDKLLAATHDLEGMRQFIGADSLAFLSVDGIYRAMGYEKRDPARPQFTDHCFTGDYPTPLTDQSATEHTRSSRCWPRRADRCWRRPMLIRERIQSATFRCATSGRRSPTTSPLRQDRPRHRRLARHRLRHRASRWRRRARMWSRSRAPSAGSKSSTTRSAPPAAPRRWCRSTSRHRRHRAARARRCNERYQRLDVLVGNAGVLGPMSPLGHVEPKAWDEVIAVNVTANFHLIRTHGPAAARVRGRPRGVRHLRRRHQHPRLSGPLLGLQGGAQRAGAHLCRRDRHHQCARQPAQSRARPAPACAPPRCRARTR